VKFNSDKLSELPITPSALCLLAVPSTPEEIREAALEKAKSGEHVDFSMSVGKSSDTRIKSLTIF
jgi:hypothetical protein